MGLAPEAHEHRRTNERVQMATDEMVRLTSQTKFYQVSSGLQVMERFKKRMRK